MTPLPQISCSPCLKNIRAVDVWFSTSWASSLFLEHHFSSFGNFPFPTPTIISRHGCCLSAPVTQAEPMRALAHRSLNWAGKEGLRSSMGTTFKNVIPELHTCSHTCQSQRTSGQEPGSASSERLGERTLVASELWIRPCQGLVYLGGFTYTSQYFVFPSSSLRWFLSWQGFK